MENIEQEHQPTPLGSHVPAHQMPSGIHDQISLAAACAHEANRLYCLTIGDDSHQHWEDAPEWQAESAFKGASLIFHDPGGTTPERSHESWLAAKEADGWVYGEVKDAEAKTHPCMVPYDQLPPEQKRKDEIFGGVVRAILCLPPAGYQLIALVGDAVEGEVAEAGESHPA